MSAPLLEVQHLKVFFPSSGRLLKPNGTVKAVDDVSFTIDEGETLGLVGESGCGKTTIGRAIVRLTEPTAGRILFQGEDLARLSTRELRSRRRHFQMIFQDPYGSLNPRMTIGESVAEGMVIHKDPPTAAARREKVIHLLHSVGLEADHAFRFPHEFSGGQRQRIGIARALAANPQLIVCDEPVSALDVSVQAQIINLLRDLQEQGRQAYLFISHDPAVVEHISNRILVLYLGKAVELGPASAISTHPIHPYTQALIAAAPSLDASAKTKPRSLGGEIPSPMSPPGGCPFHPRCPLAETRCSTEAPDWREVGRGHWVACHLVHSNTRTLSSAPAETISPSKI